MATPTLTSQALKSKKRPTGNQWRHGVYADIMDNLYANMDSAFQALETTINAGWTACKYVYAANQANLAAATKTPDTAAVVAGDRVLLTAQSASEENGIYVCGAVTATVVLTRATDLNETSEVQLGDKVLVTHGTLYANTEWRVTTVPAVLGTNALAFTQVSGGPGASATDIGTDPSSAGTKATWSRSDHAHDLTEAVLRAVAAELAEDFALPAAVSRKITNLASPTTVNDAATKGYVDGLIGAVPRIGAAVATLVDLTAVAAAARVDGQVRVVEDDGDGQRSLYIFDDASAADADGTDILAPDAGTGRWFRAYNLEAGTIPIVNATGVVLAKGVCIALSGWDATKKRFKAVAASPIDPALWAWGVLEASLADAASGALQSRFILGTSGVNTAAAAVGDPVYMTTAGALTLTKPVQYTVQKVGVVHTVAANGDLRIEIEPPVWAFRNNVAGAAAPAIGNDSTQGYGIGSFWFDAANFKLYVCKDTTTGAAVWVELLGSDTAVGAAGFIYKSAANTLVAHKSNLAAAVDPGVGNDNTQGYAVGSVWINTTAKRVFRAVDVSAGAAVWAALVPRSSFGNAVGPAVSNDDTQGYQIGSLWTDTTAVKLYLCTDATTGAAVWVDVGATQVLAAAALPKGGGQMTGNITMTAAETVDGRDLSVDGTKLDGVATGADVTANNPPQAHAVSHVTGGTDVIANAVSGGDAGLMTGTDKLDHDTTVALAADIAKTIFGTGADGAAVFNGNTVAGVTDLTGAAPNVTVYRIDRDMHFTNMTVSAGIEVRTNGFYIRCTGTLTNGGTIDNNGILTAVGPAGVFQAGGAAGAAQAADAIGNGGASTTTAPSGAGGAGGASAAARAGGAGGTATVPTVGQGAAPTTGIFQDVLRAALGMFFGGTGVAAPAGGGGGGSGGCDGVGGTGGAGGGGGGVLGIAAATLDNGNVISANGGNGAAGVTNGGSGGGGGGGFVLLVYRALTAGGTVNTLGGTSPAPGGTGLIGVDGAVGEVQTLAL